MPKLNIRSYSNSKDTKTVSKSENLMNQVSNQLLKNEAIQNGSIYEKIQSHNEKLSKDLITTSRNEQPSFKNLNTEMKKIYNEKLDQLISNTERPCLRQKFNHSYIPEEISNKIL